MKQKVSKHPLHLERREQIMWELVRKNSEHAYISDKKHPDPGLPYEIWNKQVFDENRI